MAKKTFDIGKAMAELEAINNWFQSEEVDLEEGLKKLQQAKDLTAQIQARLKKVENEFLTIKADLE